MGMFITWRSLAVVSFYLFSLLICNVSAQDDIDVCKMVYCGKGTCHSSQTEVLGFRCECDSGWKKLNAGPIDFPACVLPNCTVDLNCGNGSLPLPPPPVQAPNMSDPCLLHPCGDGTCVRNGSDFRCQCNEGSTNLLNDPKMICLKKCALGGDCNTLPEVGTPPPTSTPNSGSGFPGIDDILGIDFCKIVYCGKGTCHSSQTEVLGFRCECDSGWKKLNAGPIEFPACVLPNCTVDLQCGNGSLPPPPQPPNVSDPCLSNLCGDGNCVRSGSEFKCQCNDGSANLLNDPKMICMKKCALGGDCDGLDLGFTLPEAGTPPSTPNSGSSSPGTGSGEMLKHCSRELYMMTILLLATIFQNWI